MYTVSELVTAGLGATALGAAFGLLGGLRGALRWGRNIFFSLGLFMLFHAWLQLINFDGSWPKDQPPNPDFILSKAQSARIDQRYAGEMSKQDWDDYHRCRKLNVCIRRFEGLREGAVKAPSVTPPSALPATPKPLTETRCVVMDGVLRCHEFIVR